MTSSITDGFIELYDHLKASSINFDERIPYNEVIVIIKPHPLTEATALTNRSGKRPSQKLFRLTDNRDLVCRGQRTRGGYDCSTAGLDTRMLVALVSFETSFHRIKPRIT